MIKLYKFDIKTVLISQNIKEMTITVHKMNKFLLVDVEIWVRTDTQTETREQILDSALVINYTRFFNTFQETFQSQNCVLCYCSTMTYIFFNGDFKFETPA